MSGKSKKGGGKLPPEDEGLWKAYTKEIEPLDSARQEDVAADTIKPQPKISKKTMRGKEVFQQGAPKPQHTQTPQLDYRTAQKLKRGKLPIEARIDLHGFTQAQAHTALQAFLRKAHAAQMRCVLVITGKGVKNTDDAGMPQRGVLKRMLPLWLGDTPLRDIVLKHSPATLKDGGEGAFYIYLKRQRDY